MKVFYRDHQGRGAPPDWCSGFSIPAIPSWFSTTFHNNCGRGECLRPNTCLKTVVRGKQGHAPCIILSLQQSLFLSQLNFMENIRLSQS